MRNIVGFKAKRRATIIVCQMQEKYRRQNMNLYLVFIEMINAIEAVSADLDYGKHYLRSAAWKVH